jgi:hypothetical protein
MQIKELIKPNKNAEFFNDVQLRWFWDQAKNAQLAKGYIFTRQAGENRKSTVDALDMVRHGLIDPGMENRMLFMATFGQGKTHLALAMANFFSKSPNSPEVKYLIESLRHAYGEDVGVNNFVNLKESHPQHLVVCLQGDEVGFDLSSYFVREVEHSLSNELLSSGGMLPLWFKTALEILKNKVEPQRVEADAFLAKHQLDLPTLEKRLAEKDGTLYDIVRDLIEEVTGVRPDLGARLALHSIVSNVCEQYCGPGKPYSGLVILFDEFNAFMHAYSRREGGTGPLQDLLNGVANNKDRSVFVAFAQRDPMTIVSGLPETNRDALTVEMSRIPTGSRTWLFNNLETVLEAYIGVDEEGLNKDLAAANAWPSLLEAESSTRTLFKRRYEQELGWTPDQFKKRVTMGCFPLHPITTAMLCSVDLAETGSNARGLLQFVLKSQEAIENQESTSNAYPNWIYAHQMVDWFEKTLCSEAVHWEQYQKAVYDGGGGLIERDKAVLKAMLLHLIGKLPSASVPYDKAIGMLSGVRLEDAKATLAKLADRNWIEKDVINKKYAFYSASGGDRDLREYLVKEAEQLQLKVATLQSGENVTTVGLRPSEINVDWGNAADWTVTPLFLTSEFFKEDILKDIIKHYRASAVWVLARDESERADLQAKIQSIVDAACGSTPQPIAVFLPNVPFPGILEGLKKLQIINDLPSVKRADFATYLVGTKARICAQIADQGKSLKAAPKMWFVPSSIKAGIEADNLTSDSQITRRIILDCYKKAPPSFNTNLKEDSANLKRATAILGKWLLTNQASNLEKMLESDPNDGKLKVAGTILDGILSGGKQQAWGIISVTKHLQEPTNSRVRLAWEELNNAFPANGPASDLKIVLEKLKSPPYGYDTNALTLLICGWLGMHRHDLEITLGSMSYAVTSMQQSLDQGKPALFLSELMTNTCRVKRRDRSSALLEIQGIIGRVKTLSSNSIPRQEASDSIVKLEEFLADSTNGDQTFRTSAEESKCQLEGHLTHTDTYDSQAHDVLNKLASVKRIPDALALLSKAQQIPACGAVIPSEAPPKEIIQKANDRLIELVEESCVSLSKLSSISDYSRQEDELKTCQKALQEHPAQKQKVSKALETLAAAKQQLESRQVENQLLSTIEAFSSQVPLQELEVNRTKLLAIAVTEGVAYEAKLQKLSDVERQLAILKSFVQSLDERLTTVRDQQAIQNLDRDLDRMRPMFKGCQIEEQELTRVQGLCSNLGKFLSELSHLDQSDITSAQQHTDFQSKAAALRKNYEQLVSPDQLDLLAEVEASKLAEVAEKQDIASSWLKKAQETSETQSADPGSCFQTLNHAPAFLTAEQEKQRQLLIQAVRLKIEASEEEWIVAKFQEIPDTERKVRLLARLQQLISE